MFWYGVRILQNHQPAVGIERVHHYKYRYTNKVHVLMGPILCCEELYRCVSLTIWQLLGALEFLY